MVAAYSRSLDWALRRLWLMIGLTLLPFSPPVMAASSPPKKPLTTQGASQSIKSLLETCVLVPITPEQIAERLINTDPVVRALLDGRGTETAA